MNFFAGEDRSLYFGFARSLTLALVCLLFFIGPLIARTWQHRRLVAV